jgi:CheY-like chemotaxis protein
MSDALLPKRSTLSQDRARRKTSSSKQSAAPKVSKPALPSRPPAARSTSLPPSRGKVLVIDDDAIVLQAISDCLSSSGFQVIARTQTLGTSQWLMQNEVDLVLLDVMMPAMGGADLATFLKKRGLTKKLSVILHSSKSPSELGPLVRQTGALGAIAKTDDTASFLAEFERLAERHFRTKEANGPPKKAENR